MNDFLFITCFVPAKKVAQEATGADGLWNNKLRKRKQAMEARRQAFVIEAVLELRGRRQEDDTRDLAQSIRRDKITKDGLPRESYAELDLRNPIMHRPDGRRSSNLNNEDN